MQATLNGVRVPGDLVPLSGAAAVRLGTVSFQSTTIRQLTVSQRLGLLQVRLLHPPLWCSAASEQASGVRSCAEWRVPLWPV